MHSYVRGSPRAKFDVGDFNSFRGIACEGHTYARTHFDLVYLKHFSKVVSDFENKKKKRKKFIQYDQKVDKKGEEN